MSVYKKKKKKKKKLRTSLPFQLTMNAKAASFLLILVLAVWLTDGGAFTAGVERMKWKQKGGKREQVRIEDVFTESQDT